MVLPKLLDAISIGRGFEKIKGIGYKKDGKLYFNERSENNSLDRIMEVSFEELAQDRLKITDKPPTELMLEVDIVLFEMKSTGFAEGSGEVHSPVG